MFCLLYGYFSLYLDIQSVCCQLPLCDPMDRPHQAFHHQSEFTQTMSTSRISTICLSAVSPTFIFPHHQSLELRMSGQHWSFAFEHSKEIPRISEWTAWLLVVRVQGSSTTVQKAHFASFLLSPSSTKPWMTTNQFWLVFECWELSFTLPGATSWDGKVACPFSSGSFNQFEILTLVNSDLATRNSPQHRVVMLTVDGRLNFCHLWAFVILTVILCK